MGDLSTFLPEQSETVKRIYEWHERMEEGKPLRIGRLGASAVGKPCDRYLWYSFRKLYFKKFSGRMLRLFKTGHLEEPRFIEELEAIGCTVCNVDEQTKKQYEFTALGGHFVFYPDGIVLGVPEAPKTWHIAEFKTMGGTETQNSKDFEKVIKEGVQKAKPEHYAQMQAGMGLAGLTRALYLCKKKATDEIHGERIRYDASEFKRLMDRAERVIRAANPPDRCAKRPDDFRCKFCDAFQLCWGTGETAVPLPSKTCRSCCHATPEIDDDETWARWSCAKHQRDLTRKEQLVACGDHLLLPGLITFAEPIDSGDAWIEFKNASDGAVWRLGSESGMWSTDELMRTPGPIVGDKAVEAVKTQFSGTVVGFDTGNELTLVEKYSPGDSRLIWEGDDSTASILNGLKVAGIADGCEHSDLFKDVTHTAVEYMGRYCLVIYKAHSYAAIWEGVE